MVFASMLSLPLPGDGLVSLNLKVVEGEGMVYAPGSRATRGIAIEVADETGRRVPGVAVSFQLPDEGASGVFLNGGRADIVNTGEDGRAAVWGMRWNHSPGLVNVRITAAKNGIRAGIVVAQRLDASAASQPAATVRRGHSRALVIGLAAAAAAGAGLAAGTLRGSQRSASATVVPSITIGAPTVIIGAPQ